MKVRLNPDQHQPEVQLTQALVEHVTCPFGQPVVDAGHGTHHRRRVQRIVEVGDQEIGVVVLRIGGRVGQHQAGQAPPAEQHDEAERETASGSRTSSSRARPWRSSRRTTPPSGSEIASCCT
jgi:hypothetical protein